MSGPKCTEWSVAENLRLAALARQAALDDAKKLEGEVAAAQRELEALCARTGAALSATSFPTVRQPAGNADIVAIRTYVAQLRSAKAYLLGEAEQAESIERFRAVVAASLQVANAMQHQKAEAAQERTQRSAIAAEDALKARVENLRTLLTRLPPSTSEEDRLVLEAIAQKSLAAPPGGQARGIEMEFRARIQEIRTRESAKLREAEHAEALLAVLAGFDDPAVSLIANKLRGIAEGRGQVDKQVIAEFEAVHASARARSDREYAAEVLRDEFAALGYTVGEEFTTAFVRGGSILVSRPDRSPHSVALHFDPHATTINSEVVRRFQGEPSETDSARQDAEAEQEWCSDFGKMLSGSWKRRVEARVVRRKPAGAAPIRIVEGVVVSAATASPTNSEESRTRTTAAKHQRRQLKARQL